ncbi:MAG: hypothetical protein ABSF97_16400 [Candidatus Sulfotelmatobacter sp.]|jgi:hypothetical protein
MPGLGRQSALAISLFAVCLSAFVPARAQTPSAALDATLFTNYEVLPAAESIIWFVCGSLPDSDGCYGTGSLGPFGYVGALMEGNPSTKGDTITRAIYVLDIGAGSNKTGVILYVYDKKDTVVGANDSVTITLSKTVNLSLTGGSGALISMAANNKFLYIGTNKGGLAIQIQKNNFEQTEIVDQGSGNGIVTAITVDKYGFVIVNWGDSDGESTLNSVYNPDGEIVQAGGGGEFLLNTTQALLTSTLHLPN